MDQRSIDVVCLAVRANRQQGGTPDVAELADLLDETLGPKQWLATRTWLFREPPVVFRPGFLSVPVVCPQDAVTQFTASTETVSRLMGIERVEDVLLRQWRWVAYQLHPYPSGHGTFPWEDEGWGSVANIWACS